MSRCPLHCATPLPCTVKPENVLVFPNTAPGWGTGSQAGSRAGRERAVAGLVKAAEEDNQGLLRGHMLKLCDFGSALVTTSSEYSASDLVGRSPRGSTAYASPEVCMLLQLGTGGDSSASGLYPDVKRLLPLVEAGYDACGGDVWSWGVMVFTCMAGRLPFRTAHGGSSTFRAFVRATQGEVLEEGGSVCDMLGVGSGVWEGGEGGKWSWPGHFSPGLVHLLGLCLRVKSSERCSMGDVMGHGWFGNPAWLPPAAPAAASAGGESELVDTSANPHEAVVIERDTSVVLEGRTSLVGSSLATPPGPSTLPEPDLPELLLGFPAPSPAPSSSHPGASAGPQQSLGTAAMALESSASSAAYISSGHARPRATLSMRRACSLKLQQHPHVSLSTTDGEKPQISPGSVSVLLRPLHEGSDASAGSSGGSTARSQHC